MCSDIKTLVQSFSKNLLLTKDRTNYISTDGSIFKIIGKKNDKDLNTEQIASLAEQCLKQLNED